MGGTIIERIARFALPGRRRARGHRRAVALPCPPSELAGKWVARGLPEGMAVPADARYGGLTYGEWAAEWW